jgi:hypothetical protein
MIDIFSFHGMFHLICCGFLLYFVQKVFKIYLLGYLKDGVLQQEEFLLSLQEAVKTIKLQKKTVFDAGLAKRKEIQSLLRHVQAWALAVKKHIIVQEQEKLISQERVKAYQTNQMQGLAQLYSEKKILPHALGQAQQELQDFFSDPDQQNQFLRKALISLKKEGS